MREFLKPEFEVNTVDHNKNYGRFVLDDLERGFGITLGNALRRVLLSSIPGSAVNGVTIQGARHEYSTLEGVLEDPTAIILNLKGLIVKIDSVDPKATRTLQLEVVGTGSGDDPKETAVTAKDIHCPGDVHILNPDLVIAHVAPQGVLKMAITVANGRGYSSSEENKAEYDYLSATASGDSFPIPTDSSFSPILKVNYTVEPCRVGHKSDYDRLVLEVWTNGAIDPAEAVSLAAKILIAHFQLFADVANATTDADAGKSIFAEKKNEKKGQAEDKPIEDLELSVRSYNCLKRAGISTIGELTNKSEEEMMKVRNLGKKSLKEVKDKLLSLGLNFRNENTQESDK